MRKYIFVSPEPIDESFWMARSFDKNQCVFDKTVSSGWRRAYSILKYSGKDDVIICWDFSAGIKIGCLNRLLNKHRRIVNVNMIDHEQKGYRILIKKILYNYVFASKYFHFSANSKETIKEYKKRYRKIDINRTFELQDCLYGKEPVQDFSYGDGYVFCGGNIRDWNCYIKAAKMLPEVDFVGVASGKMKHLIDNTPSNLRMYWDISLENFYDLLKKCSISVIPVPTNITNGLIVIIQSASLNRPIIATHTPPILNLLYDKQNNKYGGLMYEMNNHVDLAAKIKCLLDDKDLRRQQCSTMEHILQKHTPECFSESLFHYVSTI